MIDVNGRRRPILVLEDLVVRHGGTAAVRGLSCTVADGEVLSIIGTNGAGKSSTLRAITGLISVASGTISYGDDGIRIENRPPHVIARRGIALVPEGRRMLADMSVIENLEIGALAARGRCQPASFDEIFELFPRLHKRREAMAGNLSGGEQQMLAIARALMSRPRMLLLDEPSLGLAPAVARDVYETVTRLNREGVSVLLVDQNVQLALEISDRYAVLRSGTIVARGMSGEANVDELAKLMGLVKEVRHA